MINVLGNNYTQFYQPAIFKINTPTSLIDDIRVGDIGMAPKAAQTFYEAADVLPAGSTGNRKYAAYASHYLQDMGNPLHTGMALEQAGAVLKVNVQKWNRIPTDISIDPSFSAPNKWLHYGYEQLVQNRWSDLRSDLTGYYVPPINDGADAVRSVANETHRYANDIFHNIYDNENIGSEPENWDSETISLALSDISNCLEYTGRYNRALLLDLGIGEKPCFAPNPC